MRIILVIIVGIALIGCSDGGDPVTPSTPIVSVDQKQMIIDTLSRTWVAEKVIFDSRDISGQWNDFSITIGNDQTYTTTVSSDSNRLIWPASGSYTFENQNNFNQIRRNDGVDVSLSIVDAQTVSLSFRIEGRNSPQVRTESLIGEYVFTMKEK